MTSLKLLIIGIDGGTFSLIGPWVKEGKLPHLEKLMKGGVWGKLESTIPPLTPPAWTSFMTGKNPGKHGLYHFINPVIGSYNYEYTNAHSRKSRTIWHILNERGYSVGVVNVPMTFPPEKVDGFMISGLDTPSAYSDYIHPKLLKAELRKKFGEPKLELRHLEFMRTDKRRQMVLDEMKKIEEHRMAVSLYLMEKHPVDVFMVVFTEADQVQHYFWHYMDPNHYRHEADQNSLFRNAILETYQHVDGLIAQFLDVIPKDCSLVLMSDHGAGPTTDRIIHFNQYLSQKDLLHFKRSGKSNTLQKTIRVLDPVLRAVLTPKVKSLLAHMLPSLRRKWERRISTMDLIDWSRTKAFCYDILPTCTNIYINRTEIFPQGTVSSDSEYEEIMTFLLDEFRNMKDPRSGERLFQNVLRKEEAFQGPHTDIAPDIVLSWWQDDGFTLRGTFPEHDPPVIGYLENKIDTLVNWSGTHRLEGMSIFSGPHFTKNRELTNNHIVDVAPTILYLLDQPIPRDFDGKVIEEVFNDEFLSSHSITYNESADDVSPDHGTRGYSEEEESMVQKRLRSLGYLE